MNQREIFEQSYIELADPIFRYIYFRVFDRDTARDLTQETFFKVWDYISSGKKVDNLKAFIYKTARNLVVNSIRDKKPTISLEELQDTIGFEVSDDAQHNFIEQTRDIASILDSFNILKEKDAELMKMRYVDDISIQDIARILSTTENSISVKIHRLLEKLKTYHNKP